MLNSEVSSVTLLLADKDTNILLAYRTLQVNKEVAEQIRDVMGVDPESMRPLQLLSYGPL